MRAAVHLERLHDGFATLLRKVAEIDIESVELIILIAATAPGAAKAFLDAQCGWPLRESCHLAQGPLSGSRRVERPGRRRWRACWSPQHALRARVVPAGGNLPPILRGVVFIGEAHLGPGSVWQRPVGSAGPVAVKRAISVHGPRRTGAPITGDAFDAVFA